VTAGRCLYARRTAHFGDFRDAFGLRRSREIRTHQRPDGQAILSPALRKYWHSRSWRHALGNAFLCFLPEQGGLARYRDRLFSGRTGQRRILFVGRFRPGYRNGCRNRVAPRVRNFSRHLAAGQIEIVRGRDWYLNGDLVDPQWIIGRLNEKLTGALGKGFEGLRASGNAFWLASKHWREFCAYEDEVNHSFADKRWLSCAPIP
jgi:hypothetical protein